MSLILPYNPTGRSPDASGDNLMYILKVEPKREQDPIYRIRLLKDNTTYVLIMYKNHFNLYVGYVGPQFKHDAVGMGKYSEDRRYTIQPYDPDYGCNELLNVLNGGKEGSIALLYRDMLNVKSTWYECNNVFLNITKTLIYNMLYKPDLVVWESGPWELGKVNL